MSSEYDDLIMLAERRELESALAKAVRARDEAAAKAATYERDWREAKSEFGTASAKLREKVRTLESALTTETRVALDYQNQRDEARRELGEILAGEAAHIKSLEGLLVDAVRERDELKAKLDAELPEAWREDLASLNECLERAERERDEALAQVARREREYA